ncbi:unnamed protein product [Euphydryas editha]|uniref:Uncharacterized protein n=1 Tax=Euphydryas editha TaxID=104508 RepID=A0AAU9U4N7_EUPED|nr:unnamed protein product [Euphydryas editha]
MSKENNSSLRRTAEDITLLSLQSNSLTVPKTAESIEDGQASSRSNEDDTNVQCTSANMYKNSNDFCRDPMFVIVDSSCVSNPSSAEILVNKINVSQDVNIKKKINVIPTDIPCTSKNQSDLPIQIRNCESREELEMVDINLQSDNEIPIDDNETENVPESIVLTYLRNKDTLINIDATFLNKKKSSLLGNVPKMETILEEVSEHSLDVHIPSYPGSPRSLDIGSETSLNSDINQDPRMKEAVEFLHQDKDFLVAAEIGNNKLLEIYIRKGADIQQVDHLGRNALHLAVCSDNVQTIKLLLDSGVESNVKDNVGMTPLSLSLMRRPSLLVANLLFDHGARLLPRSNPMDAGLFIQFAMMCTPTTEEEKILCLLVDKGAVINDTSAPGGRQALHFAAMSNNTTLIRILVSLGADLYMRNHRNETPKEMAATFKCKEAYDLLIQLEETENRTVSTINLQ